MRSAMRPMSSRPSWSRTRSRSLPGASSPRPRLPTATSATPPPAWAAAPRSSKRSGAPLQGATPRPSRPYGRAVAARNRSVSQRSMSAVRSLRAAAYERARDKGSPLLIRLQGLRSAFAGPHADHRVDRPRPDLAGADLAGVGGLDDGVVDLLVVVLLDADLDPDLGHQVHLVLGAAVDLGVAALPAVPARLAHRHALDAGLLQRRLDVVELERLDDRGDEPHASTFFSLGCAAGRVTGPLLAATPEAWMVPRS